MANNKNTNFTIPNPIGNNSYVSLKDVFDNKNYYYNTAFPYLNYILENNIFRK